MAAWTTPGDECLAGLHRYRAERGQRRQHRVEHGPKLRAVTVLAFDQLTCLGGFSGAVLVGGGSCLRAAAFHASSLSPSMMAAGSAHCSWRGAVAAP
jgi:hypothetical protein